MSWLFSRALVAAYSAANSSAGELSAPWSVMPTPQPFWHRDRTMDTWTHSPFGRTCAVLTADRGEALLTWFREGFPVRTSAAPERGPESPEHEAGSGRKWRASWAKFDPATCSWKTHQRSLLGDWEPFLETWPRWGMMRAGECWEQSTRAPRTSGRGFGLWLSPCATDAQPITGGNLYQTATGTVRHMRPDGKSSNRGLQAQVMWPTPRATEGTSGDYQRDGGDPNKPRLTLKGMVKLWQTPVADDAVERAAGKLNSRGEPKLSAQVKLWPTPKSRDWKGQSQRWIHGPMDSLANLDTGDGTPIGGLLNPDWVEWLMGWPIGWTDLEPLATDRFRQWLDSHGECSVTGGKQVTNE